MLVIASGTARVHAAPSETTATVRVRWVAPVGLALQPLVELTSTDSPPLTLKAEIRQPADLAIIRRVPAGRYRLAVHALGFRDAVADVDVRAATTYEYAAVLAASTQTATESTLEQVQAEPPANAQIFDQRFLETFPGEDVLWSPVETVVAPLVVDRISDGGLRVGEAALVGGLGSSWRDTAIALGALDVTDPARPGTPLVRLNYAPANALIVRTSMLPVSESGPGPQLTVLPKAPATVWHGGATLGAFPDRLQSENARPSAPSIARLGMHRNVDAELGGPIGARAGFFLASHVISAERFERDEPTSLLTTLGSVSGEATVCTGSQGRLQIGGTLDRAGSPYPGRARFTNRDVRETDTFMTVQATADRWTSGGTAWSASGGFAQGLFAPALDHLASSSVATVERLRDGSVPTLFDPFPGTRRRFSARLDVEPVAAILGPHHSLNAGVRVERNTAETRAVPSPPVAEMVGGIPARLWEYSYVGPESRWTSTDLAGYLADAILFPARVRVDAGVRVDMSRGAAREASNGISWLSMAPRVGLRWQPDASGRFVLFGGYSRYARPLPLDYFAYGDPAAAAGRVFRWIDDNGDHVFQDGERGPLIAAVGPCCAGGVPSGIDPGIERPLTDELLTGVEARVGPWSVRFSGVDRRIRHLVASVDTAAAQGKYILKYIPDLGEDFLDASDDRLLAVYDRNPASFGQDRYLLTNPVGQDTRYQGLELTVERRFASRWRTRFDGAAYRSDAIGANRGFRVLENDPGIVGEVFENPNASTYARGRGFFDRGYVAKWWNTYLAAKNWVVTGVVRYQDGQPFARIVVVPDLNQGAEAIQAYFRGRTRFTFTLTLDAHVEKTFRIGRGRVSGIVEIFNLLNTSEEVEEDVLTSPAFRRSTAVQPPRAVRIALRVAF